MTTPTAPTGTSAASPSATPVTGLSGREHPLTTPVGSDASMYIQWKGTDVCLDFSCECGTSSHFDGDFAYQLRCPTCATVYSLGTQVIVKRIEDDGTTPRDLTLD